MPTVQHRQSETLAPWAEVVPGATPMTMADFLAYPDGDDGYCYELVDGVLVRMAGTRPMAGRITRRLQIPLTLYVQERGLGTVTGPDEVYDFERRGQPNTGLLPDVGFYDVTREPLVDADPTRPYPFAPDLAVEVAGISQRQEALDAKARRHLAGGTALVWVIWPGRRAVDVWRSRDPQRPVATLGPADILDGEDVVEGFTFPVANLFT